MTINNQLESVLYSAFLEAINEIGIEAFKRTSMFGSNDRRIVAMAA